VACGTKRGVTLQAFRKLSHNPKIYQHKLRLPFEDIYLVDGNVTTVCIVVHACRMKYVVCNELNLISFQKVVAACTAGCSTPEVLGDMERETSPIFCTNCRSRDIVVLMLNTISVCMMQCSRQPVYVCTAFLVVGIVARSTK
jgi:hypothetical protein